jgi:hypothetical protein
MARKLPADLEQHGLGDLGSVNDAACILCVSASFLNHLRARGLGPPVVWLGGRAKYLLPELLPWAREQRQKPPKAA